MVSRVEKTFKSVGLRIILYALLILFAPYRLANCMEPDPAICTRDAATVPIPAPESVLGDSWEATIIWSDEVANKSYYVKDYYQKAMGYEKLVISVPYEDDATVLYNLVTNDVLVQTTQTTPEGFKSVTCKSVIHDNQDDVYVYNNLFWMTSLRELLVQISASMDAIYVNKTSVRGISADTYTACITKDKYNMTARTYLYLTDSSWLGSPYLPPMNKAPLRLEYRGRMFNGSRAIDVKLVGDIVLSRRKVANDTLPELFTTLSGAYCPNRTGMSMFLPSIPNQFYLTEEIVDLDFKKLYYQRIYYDGKLKMARYDYKLAENNDPDLTSYILDFQVGVQYTINRRTMTCSMPAVLSLGDKYVKLLTNGTVAMKSPAEIFHLDAKETQYVGQAVVRNVLCHTWVGRYIDPDEHKYNTVQWYFTADEWLVGAGDVTGKGSFVMMKVWMGSSGNPMIYNIISYVPSAPDYELFDFSPCFTPEHKKHATVQFSVSPMQNLEDISGYYLKLSLVRFLADRIEIQPNRFSDVSIDIVESTSHLYMTFTLLDRAILTSQNQDEKTLIAAFEFLSMSIKASHIQFILKTTYGGTNLTTENIVEHVYQREFSTTPTPVKTTLPYIVPSKEGPPLKPPTPEVPQTDFPTPPNPQAKTTGPGPGTTKSSATTKMATTSKVTMATKMSSATPCPPVLPCKCTGPAQPLVTNTPGTTCPPPAAVTKQPNIVVTTPQPLQVASCPNAPSYSPHLHNQKLTGNSDTTFSSGALAGAFVGALVLGLALGIIGTRLFHVLRVKPNQMTINLIQNDNDM